MNSSYLKLGIAAAIAAVVGLSIAGFDSPQSKVGKAAPDFKATGSDGKQHTLASLTAKGPVFLYFIKATCPVNAEAVKYFNRVAEGYKGKVAFVGIIDGEKGEYETWQGKFKAPYPVLLDPDMKIIKSYDAMRSPWGVLVGKDKKIAKVWDGYSISQKNEISASIAGAGKVAAVKIDTTGAPRNAAAG